MKVFGERYITIKKTENKDFKVRVLIPGTPILQKKKTGIPTIGQARAIAYEYRDELLKRKAELAKGSSTYKAATKIYLDHKFKSFSTKTRYGAERFFEKWTSHWSDRLITDFDAADIYNLKSEMESKVSAPTVLRNMGYVRGLFQHFVNLGKLNFNPCLAVDLPRVKKMSTTTIMSKSEIEQILEYTKNTNHPLYPFIFIAYQTGARSSEIKELRIRDFDLVNHSLKIERVLNDDGTIGPTKGGTPRTVPINKCTVELVSFLSAGRNSSERLLPEYKPFYRGDGSKILQKIQEEIGIKKTNFHSIRGSYITHLLLSGQRLTVVQRLAGHTEPSTTDRYAKLVASDVKGTTDVLNIDVSPSITFEPISDFTKELLKI